MSDEVRVSSPFRSDRSVLDPLVESREGRVQMREGYRRY